MFIALILSVLFTFVYATAAARLRRTEKVLSRSSTSSSPSLSSGSSR